MAPTSEEELKLRLFSGDLSQLGPAERFLKVMVEIPFAFKRLESLLFMSSLQEEVFAIKESFETLEVKRLIFLHIISFVIRLRPMSLSFDCHLTFIFHLIFFYRYK